MATRQLKVGDTLGAFQIEKELGRGGMGVVYKAHELSLNRKVALKVLAQRLTFENEFVERFRREAQIVAQLVHPNIVGILAYGEDDGLHYYAMEYVQGTDLTALLKEKGGISTERALQIARQVASALEEAQRHGIVHRDLKPQNIMIDTLGRAKVTDFGLARFEGGHSNLTETGVFLGTPEYASPEQASGRPLDIRSDIYAFGAVLYRIFSGRPPVTADTPLAVMAKIMTEPVTPIETINPAVPLPVRRLIQGMMARDPQDRFQTPTQVLQAIDTCERALLIAEGDTLLNPAGAPQQTLVSSAARAAPAAPSVTLTPERPLVEPPNVASSRASSAGPLLAVAAGLLLLFVLGAGAVWMLWREGPEATVGAGAPEAVVADAGAPLGDPAMETSGAAADAVKNDSPAAPSQVPAAAAEASVDSETARPAVPAVATASAAVPSAAPLPEVPTVFAAVSGDPLMAAAARAIVEKAIVDAGLTLTPLEGRSELTLLVEIQRTGTRQLTFAGTSQEQVLASYSMQALDQDSGHTVVGPSTGDFEYAGTRMKLRLTEALEPAARDAGAAIGAYWKKRRAQAR